MASGSASSGAAPNHDQISNLKMRIYETCAEHATEDPFIVFRQADLLAMEIIPGDDPGMLMVVAQKLFDEKLFKMVRDGGTTIGWMYRPLEDALKYRTLSREQEMVYTIIDDSGAEGIWSKTIKARCNIHDSILSKCIKALESKRYIKSLKSVEHVNRKMYIKCAIRPSERATGGAFHTDGELDTEFIEAVQGVLYNYIFSKSFYKSSTPTSRKKKVPKPTPENARAMRDAALEQPLTVKLENGSDTEQRPSKRAKMDAYLPLPPGYQGYPTLSELTLFVENSKIAPDTTLTEDDIHTLLEGLCFDKKIETVRVEVHTGVDGVEEDQQIVAYKALRRAAIEGDEGPRNGLTEAPCGRCPVFDLCEEGGPVGPSNCVYFREWLAI